MSELLIILLMVLIFFGVGKLPQVLKSLGEGVKAFRDGASGPGEDSKRAGEIDVTPRDAAREKEKVKEAEEVR